LKEKNSKKIVTIEVETNTQKQEIRYSNLDYLKQRTKNNSKLMMEMIALYLDHTPPLINLMKQSLQEKDWGSLKAAAHKMIPSFSIMGIHKDFENMAKKIQELAGTPQNTSEISSLILHLENVCNLVFKELEEELKKIRNFGKMKTKS